MPKKWLVSWDYTWDGEMWHTDHTRVDIEGLDNALMVGAYIVASSIAGTDIVAIRNLCVREYREVQGNV